MYTQTHTHTHTKVQTSMLEDCLTLGSNLCIRSDSCRYLLADAGAREPRQQEAQGPPFNEPCSDTFNSNTTLGIILNGMRIECVLSGGPAHKSHQVMVSVSLALSHKHIHVYTNTYTRALSLTHSLTHNKGRGRDSGSRWLCSHTRNFEVPPPWQGHPQHHGRADFVCVCV